MDSDSDLDSILSMGWVGFQIWVGLDSESIKFNRFGLGFNLFYRLGWIQNPLSLTDLDLDLDSTCSTGWVGFRIH